MVLRRGPSEVALVVAQQGVPRLPCVLCLGLPQCAPRRRAADESGVGAATSVLASSRSPARSPSRVGARLTNKRCKERPLC